MNIVLGILIYITVSFLIGGCSSTSPGSPAAFLEKQEARLEARKEMVEETIDDLPSWFVELPKEDGAIHSVGSGTSPDLQFAIDKSILHAKRMLADRIEGRLSSQVKEYLTETGRELAPVAVTDTERVTKNIMREVNVAGYSLKEMEIRPHKTFFRVYVLLMYPVGEANELLELQRQRATALNSRQQAEEGYKELDKERLRQ